MFSFKIVFFLIFVVLSFIGVIIFFGADIEKTMTGELKGTYLFWNPNKVSKEELLKSLYEDLEWNENEHPEPIIPNENPQSIVNKACPRYIMQNIEVSKIIQNSKKFIRKTLCF